MHKLRNKGRKKENTKLQEGTKRREKIEKRKTTQTCATKAQAESRGQGCCLLVRSVLLRYVEPMGHHKDVTRRPDRRQEDKRRVETRNKKQAIGCPGSTTDKLRQWCVMHAGTYVRTCFYSILLSS